MISGGNGLDELGIYCIYSDGAGGIYSSPETGAGGGGAVDYTRIQNDQLTCNIFFSGILCLINYWNDQETWPKKAYTSCTLTCELDININCFEFISSECSTFIANCHPDSSYCKYYKISNSYVQSLVEKTTIGSTTFWTDFFCDAGVLCGCYVYHQQSVYYINNNLYYDDEGGTTLANGMIYCLYNDCSQTFNYACFNNGELCAGFP